MLQDKSNNHEATWEFLNRRMDDQKNVAELLKGSKGFTDSLQTGITSIFGMAQFKKFDDTDMLKK